MVGGRRRTARRGLDAGANSACGPWNEVTRRDGSRFRLQVDRLSGRSDGSLTLRTARGAHNAAYRGAGGSGAVSTGATGGIGSCNPMTGNMGSGSGARAGRESPVGPTKLGRYGSAPGSKAGSGASHPWRRQSTLFLMHGLPACSAHCERRVASFAGLLRFLPINGRSRVEGIVEGLGSVSRCSIIIC